MKRLVFLIFCLLLGAVALAGCADDGAPYAEKTYTPDGEQIAGVCVDVRDRFVEVTPSEDGTIRITYYESDKEAYDISVSDENVLTMTMAGQKEWKDYIGAQASEEVRRISVQLPEALLDRLSVSTTNEDIAVSALQLNESVFLCANGGNITVDALAAGEEISLEVKNGNISGEISGSYDDYAISCEIKKGESNLPARKENGSRQLTVQANNGDVSLAIG